MTASDAPVPVPASRGDAAPDGEHAVPVKPQELTVVGLTRDRQRLVLVSRTGQEFTIPADARLRAALRGEHAPPGQLEITMDSVLRPRDIQARIRAGETPEQVAAAAQTPVEKVMVFATPVLAERAHIADRAQRASVRRGAGEGSARVLADAVAERLRARDVDPSSVEWDSWRRGDGRWTLVADYRSGESPRHAEFVYDTAGRYVVAEDDEARWLVGEQSRSHGPQPRAGGGLRRLSAVSHDEDELPLGEDAIELVAEPPAPTPYVDRGTGDADWIATQATERPVELGSEADEPDLPEERAEALPQPEPEATEQVTESAGQAGAQTGEQTGEQAGQDSGEDKPARRPRKGRRASVPSWDEIMFGGSGSSDPED